METLMNFNLRGHFSGKDINIKSAGNSRLDDGRNYWSLALIFRRVGVQV
jgi:hypothetical protein